MIGIGQYAEKYCPVFIPQKIRSRHLHSPGSTGFGKSTLFLNMCLSEIDRGIGVAVIEPHADLINDILERIPERHIDRVIYLDPGDFDFVPLFNPLDSGFYGPDLGTATDDLVQGIKSFVSPTSWGPRTEYIF